MFQNKTTRNILLISVGIVGIVFLLIPSSPKEDPLDVPLPSSDTVVNVTVDSLKAFAPVAVIDTFREVAYVTYTLAPQQTDISSKPIQTRHFHLPTCFKIRLQEIFS
ncbi:MAG: hypothetical protein AAFQ92_23740 [Bacteroidota bacterium]